MTPSEMEKWAARTRFGTRSKGKFDSWAQEEAELKRLLSPPVKEKTSQKPMPTIIFPIFIPGDPLPVGPIQA